jgi:hypothetical protein
MCRCDWLFTCLLCTNLSRHIYLIQHFTPNRLFLMLEPLAGTVGLFPCSCLAEDQRVMQAVSLPSSQFGIHFFSGNACLLVY